MANVKSSTSSSAKQIGNNRSILSVSFSPVPSQSPLSIPVSPFRSSASFSPGLFLLFFPRSFLVSVSRLGVARVSERSANTSIFNETAGQGDRGQGGRGGQGKLVDHADVDNRASGGASLHTSILTNFSSARRRFRLPTILPSIHSCIRGDLCGG